MKGKGKLLALLLLMVLAFSGCGGKTAEEGPEVICEIGTRQLTAERQQVLTVPVKEDCKAMLHMTYTTQDQDGAVLWLENGDQVLLMDELPAMGDGAYEEGWRVSEITLLAGRNVFSLSVPAGGQVPCTMTIAIDDLDPENLLSEQMDPQILNID